MKKVDDTVKSVNGAGGGKGDSKKDKSKKKGRPTCKRDEDEEKRMATQKLLTTPSLKFIGMNIEKLENMHVILTAEDGMSKQFWNAKGDAFVIDLGKIMDEFERDFQKLREDVRNVKDKLNKRQDLIKTLTQKNDQSICKDLKVLDKFAHIVMRNQIEKTLTDCFESL